MITGRPEASQRLDPGVCHVGAQISTSTKFQLVLFLQTVLHYEMNQPAKKYYVDLRLTTVTKELSEGRLMVGLKEFHPITTRQWRENALCRATTFDVFHLGNGGASSYSSV